MKQGELLREYANIKGISVNKMKNDLGKDSSGIYALFRTKQFSQPNYDLILGLYPDFADFETNFKIEDSKQVFESKGYSSAPLAFNSAGQTILAKITAANSYAALDLLAELVSGIKKIPLDEVKKKSELKARESLRSIEDSLLGLISS